MGPSVRIRFPPAVSQYLQCILNDEGKESRGFAGLRLRAEAELYLGLVHYDDMAGNASPRRRPGAIYRLTVWRPNDRRWSDEEKRRLGTDVLGRINGHPASRFDELLPWNWKGRSARLVA